VPAGSGVPSMDDHLLVIDPDSFLRARLSSYLQTNGFHVLSAADGREGLRIAYQHRPELVILGLALPDLDGCQMCARLRELSDFPILMLTGGSEEEAVVACLEAGADDCIGEPVRLRELEARVRALLRRARIAEHRQMPEYDDGRLRIDPLRQLVWRRGSPVHLSPTEFRLLCTLVRHSGNVVTHEDLLTEVWGSLCADSPNYLSIYVRYIREKLEEDPTRPQYIQTKWGVGYRFVPRGVWVGEGLPGK
jgi:two-component system, OmpR family, KDP operon response regulator KdpE